MSLEHSDWKKLGKESHPSYELRNWNSNLEGKKKKAWVQKDAVTECGLPVRAKTKLL